MSCYDVNQKQEPNSMATSYGACVDCGLFAAAVPTGQASQCKACGVGMYVPKGTAACVECPPGQAISEASGCAPCAPGYAPRPDGSACAPCRANSVAPVGGMPTCTVWMPV